MSSLKQQMAVAAEFEQDLHEAAEANADAAAAAYCKRALGGGHGLPFKKPRTARIVPCKSAPARHQRGEEDEPGDVEIKGDGEPDVTSILEKMQKRELSFPVSAATLRRVMAAVRNKARDEERRLWLERACDRVLGFVQDRVCDGSESETMTIGIWGPLEHLPCEAANMETLLKERIEELIPGARVTFNTPYCSVHLEAKAKAV